MQQSRIAAVIFDYGNVLARTLDPAPRAAWERRLGLQPGALQRLVHNDHSWLAAQRGQITAEAHWHTVGTALSLAPDETATLRATFYAGDVLNVELVRRIEQLRSAGLRVALLSNFSTDLRTLLAAQGLLRCFDHLAISAEIGVMKPDMAAYQAVLALLALPAHACVFIDDQPGNVAAARALGLHGIVFCTTRACLAELDRLLRDTTENRGGGQG
jgi:putative hydrolase of the HAD superfamily